MGPESTPKEAATARSTGESTRPSTTELQKFVKTMPMRITQMQMAV